MRLLSFTVKGRQTWGALAPAGLIDLQSRTGHPTLRAALEAGALEHLEQDLDDSSQAYDLAEVTIDPVIPEPGQILCIGLNYNEHREETRRENTGHPTVFARYGQSQVGHKGAILLPPESYMLDYEGELAVIIGKKARRISEADAMSVVAGFACYNDASVRDFQRHTSQFHPGKNFPATGAFGPWMVTPDEVGDVRSLSIETRLNGVVVQSAVIDQLIFSIPELIAYCSTFTELRPGDVIVTGTPGGVGSARVPPIWMKAGDVVEVAIDTIGCLSNPIVDEQPAPSSNTPNALGGRI